MAVANYESTHGHYPLPYGDNTSSKHEYTWRIALLEYIEQQPLYKSYKFDERWDGVNNQPLATRMPRVYSLHGDHKPGAIVTNYVVIVGSKTAWRREKPVRAKEITDGLSNTFAIVENLGMSFHWMEPRDLNFDTMDWRIDSPQGISSKYESPGVVMLDGHVQSLSKGFTPEALKALATIADGDWATEYGQLMTEMRDGRDRPVTKP